MMKLMTLKQYMKMSKPALIRKITKALRVMPQAKLARLCYNITKSKLPRLKIPKGEFDPRKGYVVTTRRGKFESLPMTDPIFKGKYTKKFTVKRKKRKFSRKQLAAQRLFAKRARAGTLRKRRR